MAAPCAILAHVGHPRVCGHGESAAACLNKRFGSPPLALPVPVVLVWGVHGWAASRKSASFAT